MLLGKMMSREPVEAWTIVRVSQQDLLVAKMVRQLEQTPLKTMMQEKALQKKIRLISRKMAGSRILIPVKTITKVEPMLPLEMEVTQMPVQVRVGKTLARLRAVTVRQETATLQAQMGRILRSLPILRVETVRMTSLWSTQPSRRASRRASRHVA